MKKHLVTTFICLLTIVAIGQTDTSNTTSLTIIPIDTTPPDPPDYKMVKFKPTFLFGFNSYGKFADSVLYGTNVSSREAAVGGHIKFRFSQESKWYFKTGLELGWNNYMLADTAARIRKSQVSNGIEFYQDTVNWRKSKYMRTMLTIPLFLEFNSSTHESGKKDGFKFGFGPYIGFKIASYEVAKRSTSFKEQDNGAEPKITIREPNDLHLNGIRLGIMGMIGAEEFNLFVRYDFTPVFKSGFGPLTGAEILFASEEPRDNFNTFTWGIIFQ